MNDNTSNVLIVLVIAAGISAVAWAMAWGTTATERTALQNGFVEEKVPTMYESRWVKP